MPRTRRRLRDELPDNFIMALADSFEEFGADALRQMLVDDPAIYRALLSRVLSKDDINRVGPEPSDEILGLIAKCIVIRLRRGTAAEGKPPAGRLN